MNHHRSLRVGTAPRALLGPVLLALALSAVAGAVPAVAKSSAPDSVLEFPADRFDGFDPQLAELITVLLRENAQLQSARASWESTVTRTDQVKPLPDPTLTYRYFVSRPETRVGPQAQGVQLKQAIPWSGKLGQAAQRAEHLASGVAWEVQQLERSLVAQLKQTYFNAAYLQEALTVNAEEAALLQRFERIALTRYATGHGDQQSAIKVQTEISRLADQRNSLGLQLQSAERRIAELIGRPSAWLRLQPIALRLLELNLDPQALESDSIRDHPGVRAAAQRIEADNAWLRQRNLGSRPDFSVGLSYIDVRKRQDDAGMLFPPDGNGRDIWAVSVGLSLPIHGRKIRAGKAEAQSSLQASQRTLEATRNQLRAEVQQALLRLESLEERARFYEEVIVPQAGESLASAEAAYTTDRRDFLDLLDAQRVLFQVRLTSHRLLADYWSALADLEWGLGRSFPGEGSAR